MSVPTTSWSESTPSGNDNANAGDNRIREMKTQVREVVDVDHKFDSSGQDADMGKHDQVSLLEKADIGTGAEGKPILGAQTVDGKAELMYTDEDDNDVQLTSGGKLDLGSGRLDNDEDLIGRNNADDGDVDIVKVNTSDQVEIGAAALATGGAILPEITAPTTAANQGAVYTKNDGDQTELYFREESDGDEVQITDAGAIKGVVENQLGAIEDYGASGSSSTSKNQADFKVAYGSISIAGGGGSAALSNLPFTSTGSYTIVVSFGQNQSSNEALQVVKSSGSSATIYNTDDQAQTANWIAMGT